MWPCSPMLTCANLASVPPMKPQQPCADPAARYGCIPSWLPPRLWPLAARAFWAARGVTSKIAERSRGRSWRAVTVGTSSGTRSIRLAAWDAVTQALILIDLRRWERGSVRGLGHPGRGRRISTAFIVATVDPVNFTHPQLNDAGLTLAYRKAV